MTSTINNNQKCVWVYAVGYDLVHYFQTEEEADVWWAAYKVEVDDDVEGAIEKVSMFQKKKPKCDTKNCECFAAKNKYYPNSEGGEFWTLCEKCYKEDAGEDEEEDELFKVAKGEYDTISYFKTLEEAKAEVDDMRDSHQFDYGYIMRMEGIYVDQYTVKDEVEVGYWGEYYEDWEDE